MPVDPALIPPWLAPGWPTHYPMPEILPPLPPMYQLPPTAHGELPRELCVYYNNMPARWRMPSKGWSGDRKLSELTIRNRCRDYAISERTIARGYGLKVHRSMIHHQKRSAPSQAHFGFMLALAAMMLQKSDTPDYIPDYSCPEGEPMVIRPTIMIEDEFQTSKLVTVVPYADQARVTVRPGHGSHYSNALVMEWPKTTKGHWRCGHIRYRFPGPIRRYCLSAVISATVGVQGPYSALFWMEWSWRGYRLWAGFRWTSENVLSPWELMGPDPWKKLPAEAIGRSVAMHYTPSFWEVDCENFEYTKLCTFGQEHNVKGYPIAKVKSKIIGPTELHVQVWHPWHDWCRFDIDKVLVHEYGPYLSDVVREVRRRMDVWPIGLEEVIEEA